MGWGLHPLVIPWQRTATAPLQKTSDDLVLSNISPAIETVKQAKGQFSPIPIITKHQQRSGIDPTPSAQPRTQPSIPSPPPPRTPPSSPNTHRDHGAANTPQPRSLGRLDQHANHARTPRRSRPMPRERALPPPRHLHRQQTPRLPHELHLPPLNPLLLLPRHRHDHQPRQQEDEQPRRQPQRLPPRPRLYVPHPPPPTPPQTNPPPHSQGSPTAQQPAPPPAASPPGPPPPLPPTRPSPRSSSTSTRRPSRPSAPPSTARRASSPPARTRSASTAPSTSRPTRLTPVPICCGGRASLAAAAGKTVAGVASWPARRCG